MSRRADGGSAAGRRAVLAAFGVFGLFWGAWAALLPDVQRAVGAGDGLLGLALGGLAVAALPAMPLAGRFADRAGPGAALRVTLLAFAVTVPLPALAGGLGGLVAALVLLGVSTGALDVAANAAVAGWERAEQASGGRLMQLAHASFSFGVLAGSAGAGLARQAGVPAPATLALVALVTAGAAVLVPPARRGHGVLPAADLPHPPRARLAPRLLLLGALVAAAFLVEDGLQSWSGLHLERGLGASPAVGGLGLALFGGAMGVGRLAGHVLERRVGDQRLLAGGGALTALGTALLVGAGGPGAAIAGLVIAGAGTSVLAPVLYTAVGRQAAPGQQGAELAVVSALGYGGFVAGPPLVGAVSAASSLPAALGLLAAVGLGVALAGPLVLSVSAGTAGAAPGSR